MCGFSFTVFLSAFQLLPTAPFHILALGGSTSAAGLFLGFLTYASAFSAPVTGTLADRVGPRRILIVASIAITVFSVAYAHIPNYHVMLGLVLIHGVFWSGLLTGSAAYLTNILPESRRAEGIAYWGLSTIAAIAVAPSIGFWMFHFGWRALCLRGRGPQRDHGGHCLVPAAPADRGRRREPPQGAAGRVANPDPLVHFVSLLVRLRRDHQLHGSLRRRQRGGPQGDLPDHPRRRDPGDASHGGAAGGSIRLPAGVRCRAWC